MTKEIKHPTIGEIYECIDIYGIISSRRKYIGMGGVERFSKLKNTWYKAGFGQYSYVFEKVVETNFDRHLFKYAVATPIFRGLEWAGNFQITHYSNKLENMFKPPMVEKTRFALVGDD